MTGERLNCGADLPPFISSLDEVCGVRSASFYKFITNLKIIMEQFETLDRSNPEESDSAEDLKSEIKTSRGVIDAILNSEDAGMARALLLSLYEPENEDSETQKQFGKLPNWQITLVTLFELAGATKVGLERDCPINTQLLSYSCGEFEPTSDDALNVASHAAFCDDCALTIMIAVEDQSHESTKG